METDSQDAENSIVYSVKTAALFDLYYECTFLKLSLYCPVPR